MRRIMRNRERLTMPREESGQIGNAPVIDVAIGTFLRPDPWIGMPVALDVLVHEDLQIDAEAAIRAHDHIGADATIDRHIAPRIGERAIGAIVTDGHADLPLRRVIASDLDGWKGYVGVNNHMGSRFTQDGARMAVVMDELKRRGLLWLDSKTIGDTTGPAAAKAAGLPFLERDVFLDNVETVEAVTAQLEILGATAKAHGSAIGIGHPHDATIDALKKWLPGMNARGLVLVPITEVLKRRTARVPASCRGSASGQPFDADGSGPVLRRP